MEDLNIKQLTLAVRTIAEEKNLPEETVMDVIEQAIAAAWRRDNGERDQNVRAELNINKGTAKVFVMRDVVEEPENDVNQISLEEAKKIKKDAKLEDVIEEAAGMPVLVAYHFKSDLARLQRERDGVVGGEGAETLGDA